MSVHIKQNLHYYFRSKLLYLRTPTHETRLQEPIVCVSKSYRFIHLQDNCDVNVILLCVREHRIARNKQTDKQTNKQSNKQTKQNKTKQSINTQKQ